MSVSMPVSTVRSGCGTPGGRLAAYRHPEGETVVVEMAPEDAAHMAKTEEIG
jgi:hypothetical protein